MKLYCQLLGYPRRLTLNKTFKPLIASPRVSTRRTRPHNSEVMIIVHTNSTGTLLLLGEENKNRQEKIGENEARPEEGGDPAGGGEEEASPEEEDG